MIFRVRYPKNKWFFVCVSGVSIAQKEQVRDALAKCFTPKQQWKWDRKTDKRVDLAPPPAPVVSFYERFGSERGKPRAYILPNEARLRMHDERRRLLGKTMSVEVTSDSISIS